MTPIFNKPAAFDAASSACNRRAILPDVINFILAFRGGTDGGLTGHEDDIWRADALRPAPTSSARTVIAVLCSR